MLNLLHDPLCGGVDLGSKVSLNMEQYGNTATFNVESVLQKNIVNSEYYRDTCMKLGTWEEVVDEIYYSVQDVEPWMSGNARGASSAFCLLYRSVRCAFQSKLTAHLTLS